MGHLCHVYVTNKRVSSAQASYPNRNHAGTLPIPNGCPVSLCCPGQAAAQVLNPGTQRCWRMSAPWRVLGRLLLQEQSPLTTGGPPPVESCAPMTLQRPETRDDQFYRGSHYGKFLKHLLPPDAFQPQPTRLLFGLMHFTIVAAMGYVCVGTAVAWPHTRSPWPLQW